MQTEMRKPPAPSAPLPAAEPRAAGASPEALERIGEAVYFVAQCGGPDAAERLLRHIDSDKYLGEFWDTRPHWEQIYFIQYLKPRAGFNFIVCPRWRKTSIPGREALREKLRAALERAIKTLTDAAPAPGAL